MIDLKEFGRQLAIFRLAAGFSTHEAAAEATGIDRARITRHENGSGGKPQRDTLARYEQAYRLAPGALSRVLAGERVPVPATATPPAAVSRSGAFDPSVSLSEGGATVPRHARNLPLAVREYLAEFRLRLTKADVPEEQIEEAMRLLKSPDVFSYFKGGRPTEYNEEDVLNGMRAIGEDVIVPRLRKLGRKIR